MIWISLYTPRFFSLPGFPRRRGDLVLNINNDELVLDGKTTDQRQNASNAMLIVLNGEHMKKKNKGR